MFYKGQKGNSVVITAKVVGMRSEGGFHLDEMSGSSPPPPLTIGNPDKARSEFSWTLQAEELSVRQTWPSRMFHCRIVPFGLPDSKSDIVLSVTQNGDELPAFDFDRKVDVPVTVSGVAGGTAHEFLFSIQF